MTSSKLKEKVCKICGKKFNQYNFFAHVKEEHKLTTREYKIQYEGFIECDECDKILKSQKQLTRHKQFSHGLESENSIRTKRRAEKRNIKCELCGEMFSRLNWLSRHIKEVHKETTPEVYYIKYLNKKENPKECKHCGAKV